MGHILTGMWVWHGTVLAASIPSGRGLVPRSHPATGRWEQRGDTELCHCLLPLQIRWVIKTLVLGSGAKDGNRNRKQHITNPFAC